MICQNRPGTWPKSVKESEQTKRNHPRAYARNGSANTTVIVKSPEPKNRTTRTHTTNATARVSNNAVQMSKWFMDKVRTQLVHCSNGRPSPNAKTEILSKYPKS